MRACAADGVPVLELALAHHRHGYEMRMRVQPEARLAAADDCGYVVHEHKGFHIGKGMFCSLPPAVSGSDNTTHRSDLGDGHELANEARSHRREWTILKKVKQEHTCM